MHHNWKRLIQGGAAVLLLSLASCDFIIQALEALEAEPVVEVRISGQAYFALHSNEPSDSSSAQNGYICVVHHPHCGFIGVGNNGNDIFFDPNHQLPLLATVKRVEFRAIAPPGLSTTDSGNGFGGGSYGAVLKGPDSQTTADGAWTIATGWDGSHPIKVDWHNTCSGSGTLYQYKDVNYQMSFIVSMKKNTAIIDPQFDPTVEAPHLHVGAKWSLLHLLIRSQFPGGVATAQVCGPNPAGSVHITAHLLPPAVANAASGATAMDEPNDPVTFPQGQGAGLIGGKFNTKTVYEAGTWVVTAATFTPAAKGAAPLNAPASFIGSHVEIPTAVGMPVINFSGVASCGPS